MLTTTATTTTDRIKQVPGPASANTAPAAPTNVPVEVRPGPTLHLIDLDNLVGGPSNHELVAAAVSELMHRAAYVEGDHLVFAADVVLARRSFFGLPSAARMIATRGTDGADNALIAHVSAEHIASRYARLVIASGDHAFAGLTRAVRTLRTPVEVYGRDGSVSRDLEEAAGRCCLLSDLPAAYQHRHILDLTDGTTNDEAA
jgi:hypothetical protein